MNSKTTLKEKNANNYLTHTKNEKGITLVALIITIIILLILAVISIRAITGDNILGKSETAKNKYIEAQEKEQIQLALNEWKIQKSYQNEPSTNFKSFMTATLTNADSVVGNDEGPLVVTMQGTGNKYTLKDDGTLLIGEVWVDNGDGTLIKGSETVEIGKTTYTNAVVLEKLGLKEYTGTYTGDWQVIGLEGDKLKLVSVNNVAENVTLGKTDDSVYKTNEAGNPTTELKEEIVDLNGDGNYDLEKAMWSYEHAGEKLERIVKETTGEIGENGNARSITVEDINVISGITEEDKRTFDEEYGRTYRYFYYSGYIVNQYLDYNEIDTEAEDTEEEGWSKRDCGYVDKYFISNDKTVIDSNNQNNVVKLQHTNYIYKFTEKGLFAEKTDAFDSLTTGDYWLNSKNIMCGRSNAYFIVCNVGSGSIYQPRFVQL